MLHRGRGKRNEDVNRFCYLLTYLRIGQSDLGIAIVSGIAYCLIYSYGTPRICNFILLLMVWVRSFSKMLPSVKFEEDNVFVFVILSENATIVQV